MGALVEGASECKPSDFPWLIDQALAMRRAAVDALQDMLSSHGEVLPLASDDGVELFVLNTIVIDALDTGSARQGEVASQQQGHGTR